MKRQAVCLREGAIAEVGNILKRSGKRRLFLVLDEVAYAVSGAEGLLEPLFQDYEATRFCGFEMNPKLEDVERGGELYRQANPDMVIAIGGGTAIDLGKLIRSVASQKHSARELITGATRVQEIPVPLLAIPTTAGTGSEATHFAVAYVDGVKYSLAHSALLPEYAIVDSTLTHSLPASITASTGLDAFCQAIESIWAVDATVQSIEYAQEAAKLILDHLQAATSNTFGEATAARRAMAKASHLAGKAINISRTTAAHALSYAITSKFGIPHGIAVAMNLSPVLAFNAQVSAADCLDPRGPEHVLQRIDLILSTLGVDTVLEACIRIENLISEVGCPNSLPKAGISTEKEFRWIAKQVNEQRLSNNPRDASSELLFELLANASEPSSTTQIVA